MEVIQHFTVRFSSCNSKQPFSTFHKYIYSEPRFVDVFKEYRTRFPATAFSMMKSMSSGRIPYFESKPTNAQ